MLSFLSTADGTPEFTPTRPASTRTPEQESHSTPGGDSMRFPGAKLFKTYTSSTFTHLMNAVAIPLAAIRLIKYIYRLHPSCRPKVFTMTGYWDGHTFVVRGYDRQAVAAEMTRLLGANFDD